MIFVIKNCFQFLQLKGLQKLATLTNTSLFSRILQPDPVFCRAHIAAAIKARFFN